MIKTKVRKVSCLSIWCKVKVVQKTTFRTSQVFLSPLLILSRYSFVSRCSRRGFLSTLVSATSFASSALHGKLYLSCPERTHSQSIEIKTTLKSDYGFLYILRTSIYICLLRNICKAISYDKRH